MSSHTHAPRKPAYWEVKTMTGFKISTPFIVTDPACPEGRHPTRWCGCEVFRTRDDAEAYAREKNGGGHR